MNRARPQALAADRRGRIVPLPDLEAVGMKGGHFFRLSPETLVKLPFGSELFRLPGRRPIGYQPGTKRYLTAPHFAAAAFSDFIGVSSIDMVQWRNLNFDPLDYFRQLKLTNRRAELLGISQLIGALKNKFPRLMIGYYNPSRQRIKNWRDKLKREG